MTDNVMKNELYKDYYGKMSSLMKWMMNFMKTIMRKLKNLPKN